MNDDLPIDQMTFEKEFIGGVKQDDKSENPAFSQELFEALLQPIPKNIPQVLRQKPFLHT